MRNFSVESDPSIMDIPFLCMCNLFKKKPYSHTILNAGNTMLYLTFWRLQPNIYNSQTLSHSDYWFLPSSNQEHKVAHTVWAVLRSLSSANMDINLQKVIGYVTINLLRNPLLTADLQRPLVIASWVNLMLYVLVIDRVCSYLAYIFQCP
jgi:hypothetical protein